MAKEFKLIQNIYLNYLVALIYAFIFVYIIPWVDLNGEEFKDIPNYIERIVYLRARGTEAEFSGLSWFLSEPLWKEIIIFIGYTFEDYREVIYGISLIVSFIYISFLLKRVEFYIIIIFLINPMLVNLFMEQIRIAVAFSLVLIAYDIVDRNYSARVMPIILLFSAFLIHASMIVFYAIFYLLYYLNRRVEDKKYYLVALATALFIALFMKYGSNILLMMAGDRRANYGEVIEASSLAFSIAWFMIAVIIATFAEFKEAKNRVIAAYAITMMSFFFFSSLLNMFAARYVAVIAPFIIISIGYLPKHIKQGTYLFLVAYNFFSFKYWLKLSLL
jgi:hypothetical protein